MAFDDSIEKVVLQVPGSNQIKAGNYVLLDGKSNGSPRVMLLGNSVTWHGPAESIGWSGDWGMAASTREKDFAHLLIAKARNLHPDTAFCIVQGSTWERELDECDLTADFAPARDFSPDVVCFALGANTPAEKFDANGFMTSMSWLLCYLTEKSVHPQFIICTNFWRDAKTETVRTFARENGLPLVELSDVLVPEENRAIGSFWHDGVANHPGDLGMRRIAERIWKEMKLLL